MESNEKSNAEPPECEEHDCSGDAAVRLSIPWDADRTVCPACARAAVQQDGVVAEPLDGRDDAWP